MGVTIKQVAAAAGVSVATVSKVYSDSYSISDATKEHVRQVAKKLGYIPNARAQNLARQASKSVFFIGELPEGTALCNPHIFEILLGAEKALGDKGYTLTVRNNTKKGTPAMVRDVSERKAADGFLLHASIITRELASLLAGKEIPHIVIGRPHFPTSRLCWIDNDNQLAGDIAARHIIDTGRRRIAFIGGIEGDKISMNRLAGCQTVFAESDLELFAVKQGKSTVQDAERMAHELFSSEQRPDAVICANNNILFGVYSVAKELGIVIPKDMAVITFDDYPFAQILTPAATSVSIDVYDMGVQAGKLLVTKIKKPGLLMHNYSTLPKLEIRYST